jgi:hypothetical protein
MHYKNLSDKTLLIAHFNRKQDACATFCLQLFSYQHPRLWILDFWTLDLKTIP